MTRTEAEFLGRLIGRAIARDVIADSSPMNWTGLDPQDADHIPAGTTKDTIKMICTAARVAYDALIDEAMDREPPITQDEAEKSAKDFMAFVKRRRKKDPRRN